MSGKSFSGWPFVTALTALSAAGAASFGSNDSLDAGASAIRPAPTPRGRGPARH